MVGCIVRFWSVKKLLDLQVTSFTPYTIASVQKLRVVACGEAGRALGE